MRGVVGCALAALLLACPLALQNQSTDDAAAKNARQAEQLAHKIKGAAGNVTAWGLQEIARTMEDAARSGDLGRLEDGMDALLSEFDSLSRVMTEVSKI